MGRPLNKRLFGANASNNIKIQFYNGTASVAGYIVKQKGSKRFLCRDADGNSRLCYLKNKASADLGPGEMSITVMYDNGSAQQITKIAAHRVTVNNSIQGWTFDPSTSDGLVQIEEAGTDDQLTDNTDLEGDDAPPFNLLTDYPVPGSGTLGSRSLPGYNAVGSPSEPSGSITNVTGFVPGLVRAKYLGNFCATASTAPASWNYAWFDTATYVDNSQISDTFGGFGAQQDLENVEGGHNFSLQAKGFIRAPISQTYNFYGLSDDHMAIWIGAPAMTGYDNTNAIIAGHNSTNPSVSVTMDAGKWYPIRIWFSEFLGNCQSQFWAVGSLAGGQFPSNQFEFKYNPQGMGW